jgi:hypothetical protein
MEKAVGLAAGGAVAANGGSVEDVGRAASEAALKVGATEDEAAAVAGEAAGAAVLGRGGSVADAAKAVVALMLRCRVLLGRLLAKAAVADGGTASKGSRGCSESSRSIH